MTSMDGLTVNPDTGDVTVTSGSAPVSGGVWNDVWSTIKGGGGAVINQGLNIYRDIQVARTRATPSGSPGPGPINLFPGTQSAFPQNDTKNLVGGNAGALGSFAISLPLLALAAVVLFLLIRRR